MVIHMNAVESKKSSNCKSYWQKHIITENYNNFGAFRLFLLQLNKSKIFRWAYKKNKQTNKTFLEFFFLNKSNFHHWLECQKYYLTFVANSNLCNLYRINTCTKNNENIRMEANAAHWFSIKHMHIVHYVTLLNSITLHSVQLYKYKVHIVRLLEDVRLK